MNSCITIRKLNYLFAAILFSHSIAAQVGINTTSPHPKAALHIGGDKNKGLLIPRIDSVGAVNVSELDSTANSMLYYDLSSHSFVYYDSEFGQLVGVSPWLINSLSILNPYSYYKRVKNVGTTYVQDIVATTVYGDSVAKHELLSASFAEVDTIHYEEPLQSNFLTNTIFADKISADVGYLRELHVETTVDVRTASGVQAKSLYADSVEVRESMFLDTALYINPSNEYIAFWPDSLTIPEGWEEIIMNWTVGEAPDVKFIRYKQ